MKRESYTKAIRPSLIVLVHLLATATGVLASTEKTSERVKPVLILTKDITQYQQVVGGFNRSWKTLGQTPTRTIFIDDAETLEKAAQNEMDYALILSVGTPATETALRVFQEIPVIFAMVLYPSTLPETHPSHRLVTGISAKITPKLYLDFAQLLTPSPQKIGVLYRPKVFGAYVQELSEVGDRLGIQFVWAEVDTTDQLIPRFDELMKQEMDQFLILPDPVVYQKSFLSYVLLETFQRNRPCIGSSYAYVKSGTLWGLMLDLPKIGGQAALMAQKVISGQRPPQEWAGEALPVFNGPLLKKLSVSIPSDLMKETKSQGRFIQ